MHNKTQAERRLTRLITILCTSKRMSERFFGINAAGMTRIVTDQVPTMATDGRRLYVNPDFLAEKSDSDALFILAHEAFHRVARHPQRMRDTPKHKHVQRHHAMDYAVNLHLVNDPQFRYPMPKDGLFDNKFRNSAGDPLNAETIYHLLDNDERYKSNVQNGVAGYGAGEDNACGDLLVAGDDDDGSGAIIDAVRSEKLIKAIGTAPKYIEELVKESTETGQRDWLNDFRQLLVTAFDKNDFSMRRPNPRYAQFGTINPILRNPAINRAVIGIDTSGSMSAPELALAANQIKAIIEEWKPLETHIVQCDAAIHKTEILTAGQEIQTTSFKGRGGTRFLPVFNYADSVSTDVLVILSDLGASDYEKITRPSYLTIFCDTDPRHTFGSALCERAKKLGEVVDITKRAA